MRIPIKFLHPYHVYNAGEIARFNEAEAKKIVEQGYAVYRHPDMLKQGAKLQALREAPKTKEITEKKTKEVKPEKNKAKAGGRGGAKTKSKK